MRAPAHLRENRPKLKLLRRWARLVKTRMGGSSVYLCGSALHDGNADPRDWDIRVNLTAAEFRRFYGDPDAWEDQGRTGQWQRERIRWSDDCVKISKEAFYHVSLNVDFQVYPRVYAKIYRNRPRYLLA